MLVLPFQISETEYNVVVILEDENIERIKEHDPAEIHTKLFADKFASRELKGVMVAYASPSEKENLIALVEQGDLPKVFSILSRGFKFRPEKGDHDEPYRKG